MRRSVTKRKVNRVEVATTTQCAESDADASSEYEPIHEPKPMTLTEAQKAKHLFDGDTDTEAEPTTFEQQLYQNQQRQSLNDPQIAANLARIRRHSIISRYNTRKDEVDVLHRLNEMQRKGNSVIGKLTKVFGNNTSGSNMDAQQLLREAEADQKYKRLRRSSRIIIQITRDNMAILPPYILHPETTYRAYWDIFMLLLVCYYAMVTPVNISFDPSPFDILALEVIFNVFFVIDICLQFFTSYKHEKGPNAGRLETRHRVIVFHYLRGWFLIDFLASFPLDIIIFQATGETGNGGTINRLLKLVRSVKLMRILRMSRIWKRLLHRVKLNPSVVRLFKLFGFLLIEWHWIGCMYWGIATSEGFNDEPDSDGWAPPEETLEYSFESQYIRAYFWAVMVTTGVGKDIIPQTDVQYLFTTAAIIVGVLMYAVIVGSVGTALQSIDTPDSQRRRRIDAVREYLRQRNVTEVLTERIINYYDYCYTRHISQHDENVLHEIHSALKEKLDLEVNQQLLTKVPRFKQLPDGLLLVLIHSLVSRIYLPNELVYIIGERASEMFFVVRGDLEKLDEYGTTRGFLTDGAFFGDQMFKENGRRKVTMRCITHCELLILTKGALRKIMRYFPEFAMTVHKWSGQGVFSSLHGWERVRYIIKSLRHMRIMGASVSFMDVAKYLTGLDERETDGTIKLSPRSRRVSLETQMGREMDYEQFRVQFGDTLNTFKRPPDEKRNIKSDKASKFFKGASGPQKAIKEEDEAYDASDDEDNEQETNNDQAMQSVVSQHEA